MDKGLSLSPAARVRRGLSSNGDSFIGVGTSHPSGKKGRKMRYRDSDVVVVRPQDAARAAAILRAANVGGSWALDVAADLAATGQLWPADYRSYPDRLIWAHTTCAQIIRAVDQRVAEEEAMVYPEMPTVEQDVLHFGWGRSGLALTPEGEIIALRGTVPEDEWETHPRRLALR
jgi:hypothetical protein